MERFEQMKEDNIDFLILKDNKSIIKDELMKIVPDKILKAKSTQPL